MASLAAREPAPPGRIPAGARCKAQDARDNRVRRAVVLGREGARCLVSFTASSLVAAPLAARRPGSAA